jgi:hypothetical protein
MRHEMKFGIGDPGTDTPINYQLALETCDVSHRPQLVAPDEMRGQIAHAREPVTAGLIPCGGSFSLRPRPDDLVKLLPLIFGGTFAAGTLDPGALNYFPFGFDRKVKVHTYTGCKVGVATFASSAGQTLALTCQIEGKTYSIGNAGTFPSLSLSLLQPYMHHQAVLNLNSVTAIQVNNIQIQVNNGLIADRFMNSQTRVEVPQGDRIITFSCDNPFTTADYALFIADGVAGITGSVVYTNATYSLTFSFPCLQYAPEAPAAPARGQEMPLRLQFTARQKSGDPIPQEVQIVVTP